MSLLPSEENLSQEKRPSSKTATPLTLACLEVSAILKFRQPDSLLLNFGFVISENRNKSDLR